MEEIVRFTQLFIYKIFPIFQVFLISEYMPRYTQLDISLGVDFKMASLSNIRMYICFWLFILSQ